MSATSLSIEPTIYDYLMATSVREPPILARLREETAKMPNGGMQISPEHGQFMGLLVRALGVKKAIELGTFTGYSAIVVASALPDEGRLVCCDVSEEYTSTARRYWKAAGLENKIDLRIGPALATIDTLLAEGGAGTFDFAFIDADKPSYDAYYEGVLSLLRPGGMIAIDNVFQRGRVADPNASDDSTAALRALNRKIPDDDRVYSSMLPVGDGLTLVLKK
jgi:predicted O-methyltransferase YrrM